MPLSSSAGIVSVSPTRAPIASPQYAGGVAGVVKNAVDWLVGTGELYRKPVAVLTAATSGGIEARRMTVQTLSWQGAYVVGELGIAAPRTKWDENNTLTDEATERGIAALVDGLVRLPAGQSRTSWWR